MQALGEAGVRGFSRPGVESSSLYDNTVGAVFPQPAEFFIVFSFIPFHSILFLIFTPFGSMLNFYYLHGRAKASLPGFKVLPLRQFGTWGPVMTDEFNPQKDTYVLVNSFPCLKH